MKRTQFIACLSLVAICFASVANATVVVIDSGTDVDAAGLGSYKPITGSDAGSAFGQIDDLIIWSPSGGNPDTRSLDDANLDTVGEFLALISNPGPITTLVFGLGVNQVGTNPVDMTQLDMTFGANAFSLGGGNSLRVTGYGSGQSEGEAFLTLDLGFNLRDLNSSDAFAITSTITGRDDGLEVLYLAAAVPEASSFLFGGLACSIVGAGYFRKKYRA